MRAGGSIRIIGMKEISLVLIWTVFVVTAAAESDESATFDRPYDLAMDSMERRVPGVLERRLSVIKNLIDGLENKIMKRMSYGGPCLGAGMSHNCEFGDLNQALKHVQQISSSHFPGRRKRSNLAEGATAQDPSNS